MRASRSSAWVPSWRPRPIRGSRVAGAGSGADGVRPGRPSEGRIPLRVDRGGPHSGREAAARARAEAGMRSRSAGFALALAALLGVPASAAPPPDGWRILLEASLPGLVDKAR